MNELATEDHRRSESGVEQEVEELDSDDVSGDEEEQEDEHNAEKARAVRQERITTGKLAEREEELVHVLMSEMNEKQNLVAWVTQRKQGHKQGRILAVSDFRVMTLKKGKMTRKGHSTLYVSKSMHLFDLLSMRSDAPTKVTLIFKSMQLEIDSVATPNIIHSLRAALHKISPPSKLTQVEDKFRIVPGGDMPFTAEVISAGDAFVNMYQAWCNYHGGHIRLSVCKYLQSLFPIAADGQASVDIRACFQEEMQGCAVPLNSIDMTALGATLQDSQLFHSIVASRLPWAGPTGAAALLGGVITPPCSLSLTTLCLRQVGLTPAALSEAMSGGGRSVVEWKTLISLKHLDLSCNPLGNDGIKALATLLSTLPLPLESLSLQRCGFSKGGLQHLLHVFTAPPVSGAVGSSGNFEFSSWGNTLRLLELSENKFLAAGSVQLSKWLGPPAKTAKTGSPKKGAQLQTTLSTDQMAAATRVTALERLLLAGCFGSATECEKVVLAIVQSGLPLRLLDLADNNISTATATHLGDIMAKTSTLRNIRLTNTKLSKQALRQILIGCAMNKAKQQTDWQQEGLRPLLDFSRNDLSAICKGKEADMGESSTKVGGKNRTKSSATKKGAIVQAEKNKIRGVQEHASSPNWLGGADAGGGGGAVIVGKERSNLEELSTWQLLGKARPMAVDLSWCSLGTAGLALASRHLRTVSSLSVLYIGGNCRPGKVTAAAIGRLSTDLAALLAINSPLRLRELRLDTATGASTGTADVGDQFSLKHSLVPLLASLATNNSLTGLFISGNQCGDKGADALGMALATNTTLRRLDWDGNRTTEHGFRQVLDGLKTNRTLVAMPTPAHDVLRVMKKGGQSKREIDELMMQIEACMHTNRMRDTEAQQLQLVGEAAVTKPQVSGGTNRLNKSKSGGSGSSALQQWRRTSVMLELQMQVEQGTATSRSSVALGSIGEGASVGMDATEEEIEDELMALMNKASGGAEEARVLGSPSPKGKSAPKSFTNGGRGSFVARDMPVAFAAVSHPANDSDAIQQTGEFGFDDIGSPDEQIRQTTSFAMANPMDRSSLMDSEAEVATAAKESEKEGTAAAKAAEKEAAAAAKAERAAKKKAEAKAKKEAKEAQVAKEKESLDAYKREKERLAEEARARADSYEQQKGASRFGYWNEKADEHQNKQVWRQQKGTQPAAHAEAVAPGGVEAVVVLTPAQMDAAANDVTAAPAAAPELVPEEPRKGSKKQGMKQGMLSRMFSKKKSTESLPAEALQLASPPAAPAAPAPAPVAPAEHHPEVAGPVEIVSAALPPPINDLDAAVAEAAAASDAAAAAEVAKATEEQAKQAADEEQARQAADEAARAVEEQTRAEQEVAEAAAKPAVEAQGAKIHSTLSEFDLELARKEAAEEYTRKQKKAEEEEEARKKAQAQATKDAEEAAKKTAEEKAAATTASGDKPRKGSRASAIMGGITSRLSVVKKQPRETQKQQEQQEQHTPGVPSFVLKAGDLQMLKKDTGFKVRRSSGSSSGSSDQGTPLS
jgi:hypothetical protein